jgi:glutathione synthase/RimK-type ligase-like ATP-grasp enzyme
VNKLIRWGCTDNREAYNELNGVEGINNASNKLRALQLLKDAEVSVPWFTYQNDNEDACTVGDKFPLVGRTTYHQGGSGFNICRSFYEKNDDYESTHWLELIDIFKEYRVHVFNGEAIGVSRKTDEGVEDRIINKYTRNHANGWRFIRCDMERVPQRLKQLGIEAVGALGLDFGAVDIILSKGTESTSGGNRRYYVLEVNSAPSMEVDSTIFAKYIDRMKQWLYP